MKLKRILAVVIAVILMLACAGCNYIRRPSGAVNNAEDISDKLAVLLKTPAYTYEGPQHTTETQTKIVEDEVVIPGGDNSDNNNDEPVKEPDPVLTPFTSIYDPANVLSKISALIGKIKSSHIAANSATGVGDELLSGRQVKIYVPESFPLDPDDPAIRAIAAQYNCAIQIRRAYSGSRYTSECRRAVLAGDRGDLMYVDNAIWGDVHPLTQSINSFVNFDLARKLDTFDFNFSKNYFIRTSNRAVEYYVASGIGAPYLLAFNPAKVKAGDVAEESQTVDGAIRTLRAVKGTDPVEMYNNREWSISVFDAFLKASTSGSQTGLASRIDDLKGLDIWYGMDNALGFEIDSKTGIPDVSLTGNDNLNVDRVQQWYWDTKGADGKSFIGSFVKTAQWDDGTVFKKMLGVYPGNDVIKSYAFVGCEIGDVVKTLDPLAKEEAVKWDFVSYPYGITSEQINRAFTKEEFAQVVGGETIDDEGLADPCVAGWTGGFAVLKTCQAPSVALRIGEELTKIWKTRNETPFLSLLDETQKARYADMKEHIALSFTRGWVEKAADVNEVYPGLSQYLNGRDRPTTRKTTELLPNPDSFTNDRTSFLGLSFFDGDPLLAVSPIYHKDTKTEIYTPGLQKDWTGFFSGSYSEDSDAVMNTGGVSRILNASLFPNTLMFTW